VQTAEIEVFGQPSSSPRPNNIAAGKPVTGTAPLSGTSAALTNLTDGSIDGDWNRTDDGGNGAGMYASDTVDAYVQVDLGGVYPIEYVNIYDRVDFNTTQGTVTIEVLAANGSTVLDSTSIDLNGTSDFDHSWRLGTVRDGQYVKVTSPTGVKLALSEIEVFTVPPKGTVIIIK